MIQRRAWLFLVGGGLLAACTAPVQEPETPVQPDPPAQPDLPKAPDSRGVPTRVVEKTCILTPTREGRTLGHHYMRMTPVEAVEVSLRGALPQGAEALATRIAADYAGDDVVVLRGWILARHARVHASCSTC